MTPQEVHTTLALCLAAATGMTLAIFSSLVPNFALRSLVFQIIEVFDFSIGYNGEFEFFGKKIVKDRKLKISKIPNVVCENHWWENSGQVSKKFLACHL